METEIDLELYRPLAACLDALPNGFPPAADHSELRLLSVLFTPQEARLASALRPEPEPPALVAARCSADPQQVQPMLKSMAKRGLITCTRAEDGLRYALMPFVVGIYEMQVNRIDAELASLFETYYRQAFGRLLAVAPQVHRVIPVQETIKAGLEIAPYESVSAILDRAQAWGVVDCICRKQKALVGDPCEHPLDVCMVLGSTPGMFDASSVVRALSRDQAQATLQRAAAAGLVHSVSNTQEGGWYICNCCTCSCGILRGMADLGLANVVARSAYVNTVDETLCGACLACLDACQFSALSQGQWTVQVDEHRCVGCGVCVPVCPEQALVLVNRPSADFVPPPVSEAEWRSMRLASRGLS